MRMVNWRRNSTPPRNSGKPRRHRASHLLSRQLLAALAVLSVVVVLAAACASESNATTAETLDVRRLGPICGTARKWRDAAEALEVTANTVNRGDLEGRQSMNRQFATLANITLPVAAGGPESDMLADMRAVTSAAERWLSDLSLYIFASGQNSSATTAQRIAAFEAEEDSRLTWNAAMRAANSHLASVCGIEPIELYKDAEGR